MRPMRNTRSVIAVAVLGAALIPGCYEADFPLDPAPRLEVEEAWLGTWRCLPFDADADEPPVTVSVKRAEDRRYDITWLESGKGPERYEAFASAVGGARFWNIRELKPTGEKGQWAYLRPRLLRANVAQLQVVDRDALKGVEASPATVRRALERRLSSPALTMDFCVCVGAKEVADDSGQAPSVSNLDVVRRIHATSPYSKSLLGSGVLAEDVEWWAAGSRERLPWAGSWRGRDGIVRFFEALNAVMDYERFETEEYVADGGAVVTIISASGHAIPTGRPFESHIVRVYSFAQGKIVRIRNYYDTAAYERALDTRPPGPR